MAWALSRARSFARSRARPWANGLIAHKYQLLILKEFIVVFNDTTASSKNRQTEHNIFFNVGTLSGVHLFDHLPWPIFQSSMLHITLYNSDNYLGSIITHICRSRDHKNMEHDYSRYSGAFIVYYLSFNLSDLKLPEKQSTSIRYLWVSMAILCHARHVKLPCHRTW